MKRKLFLTLMYFVTFYTHGKTIPSLTLKPTLDESNKGFIEIRPLKSNNLAVVQLNNIAGTSKDYQIVKVKQRGGGGFHLVAVDTNYNILSKNSSKTLHKGSLVNTFDYYLPKSKDIIKLIATEMKNKNIVDDYKKDEFPQKVDFKNELKNLASKCSNTIKVNWRKSVSRSLKNRSIHLIHALKDLCQSDADYKAAISVLSSIEIGQSTKSIPEVVMKSKKLIFNISEKNYRLKQFSKKWLEDNL